MDSDRGQEYQPLCLTNHEAILIQNLTEFFIKKAYVNVTLVCKGEEIMAHQTILASCSPVFDTLLRGKSERHPIIIFNDVSKEEMMLLLEFMYKGRVNVPKNTLASLLKIARNFKIRGFECDISRTNGPASSELNEQLAEDSGVRRESFGTSTPNRVKIEPNSAVNHSMSPRKKFKSDSSLKINPWAKRQRRIHDDSDSTFCEEDLAKPGPSKPEVISPPTNNYDSDIEIIDSNPLVVINETQPDVDSSPEWFRKTQPKNKKKTTRNDGDILCNVSKKENNTANQDSEESAEEKEVRNLSAATAVDGTSLPVKLLKKKFKGRYTAKENIELLKLPFSEIGNYCLLCFRFHKDIITHIKRDHNVSPRRKAPCKICSKAYHREEFLMFHKCRPL